ncbi:MAG TPA: endonuclease VIII [Syntrophomonadaceae bacterium]|nr:endonuclease VIII [Syntrophomonadaceae bacterium]
MLELPEAFTLANQINDSLNGKRITRVVAAHTPHKFAWFYGDPQRYPDLLVGKRVERAEGYGGFVEIKAELAIILVGDGVGLRFHDKNEKPPQKHQLFIAFEDSSSLTATVQMYGGLWCFTEGELDNPYYTVAREKPSPLSAGFDRDYFKTMISSAEVQKLSVKAFLATGQRIPGLGNGVLQDILYHARIHPRRKIIAVAESDREALYRSIKGTLAEMTDRGGRDTEKDLFGHPGGYKTKMSKNTVGRICSLCGGTIQKEIYLGGSVYYCNGCQS